MVEPVTTQKSLIVPNTGDLSGAWGTSALNPNFQTVDALFGGVTTITLSAATTLLLTVPATTGVWPGSLSQSVNSLIVFTGAQTGGATVQFTLPGYYIIHNKCTGTSYVQLSPSVGLGNRIGAPPGQKIHVFYDGTDMDYVNMPTPGSALDLHTNTTTLPPWMNVCSVAPYLVKDGSVYTASIYPALAQLLGSTYGGNGITTFGVPDERSRVRLGVDTIQVASGATAARITFPASGFTGSLLGPSGGGSQTSVLSQANLPNVNFSSNSSGFIRATTLSGGSIGGTGDLIGGQGGGTVLASAVVPSGGSNTPFASVQPSLISTLPLIKT